MRVKLNAWPEDTPDFVSHSVLAAYIQDTSVKTGVHDATVYGARVKNLEKKGQSWEVTWSKLDGDKEVERVEVRHYSLLNGRDRY